MFDTMTVTKIVGGFGGALLGFLLLNMASGALFGEEGGHGEEQVQAYVIDTGKGAAPAEATAAPAAPDFAAMVAKADAAKGEKTFGKCKACHKISENATGPHLSGVVGRDVASVADFKYSKVLQGLGGQWTPERLNAFLTKPKDYAPGTKMSFAGLKKISDRANVVAYLETLSQ